MAWAVQSAAVTICWHRAVVPGQAYIAPVPGVGSKTVTPSDNTAHIPGKEVCGRTRAGHVSYDKSAQ